MESDSVPCAELPAALPSLAPDWYSSTAAAFGRRREEGATLRLRMRAASGATVALLLLGCGTAALVPPGPDPPSGRFSRIELPVDREVLALHVAPSGEFLVVDTTGPSPAWSLVYDAALRVVNRVHARSFEIGFASRADVLLTREWGDVLRVRAVPSFAVEREFTASFGTAFRCALIGLPRGTGWAIVPNFGGQVHRVEDGPLRLGASGNLGLGSARAVATDGSTGLGVIVGDGSRLAGYDFEKMEPAFVVDLPCRDVGTSLGASDGCAWVGTRDGSGRVVRVDLRTRSVTEVIELGSDAHTYVACSRRTGETVVAAATTERADPPSSRVMLKRYEVVEGRAVERASQSVRIDESAIGLILAVFDDAGVAVLAGKGIWAWDLAPN